MDSTANILKASLGQFERNREIKAQSEGKSLIAKLVDAVSTVDAVEKRGRNETQRYDYVKAVDVAKALRKELFSRGILIVPDEESIESQVFETSKGGKMREVALRVTFRVMDENSELKFSAYGIAMDSGDKAIYKAKTGALKYFLRGLGLIPDEADDPDKDETVDRAAFTHKIVQPVPYAPTHATTAQMATANIADSDEFFTDEAVSTVMPVDEPENVQADYPGENVAYREEGDTVTFTVHGIKRREGKFGEYPEVYWNDGKLPYYSKWGNDQVYDLKPGQVATFKFTVKGQYKNLIKLVKVS